VGARRRVIGLGAVGKGLAALGVLLVIASPTLQQRSATVTPAGVPEGTTVVLLAGAADADRRLDALEALCKNRHDRLTVLVGDDDEVDDATGRAWGPLLVDRVMKRGGCFRALLVEGRVRTTTEELGALDRFLSVNPYLATRTVLFVTSPYHRARVDLAAGRLPMLGPLDRRFLDVHARTMDYAPTTTGAEFLRIVRDALGLSDLFGRRTIDDLREDSPWPRPHGSR
jgi:hypothetical protein